MCTFEHLFHFRKLRAALTGLVSGAVATPPQNISGRMQVVGAPCQGIGAEAPPMQASWYRAPLVLLLVAGLLGCSVPLMAAPQAPPQAATSPAAAAAVASDVPVPQGFIIGAEDVVGVLFWRDTDMSGDHLVRPDGMITLPLLGDVRAAGLRPGQLAEQIRTAAAKYLTESNVSVVVRQINSRKVFITGEVRTPGAYPLTSPRTIMQLIALAGGLTEFADAKNIMLMRISNGQQQTYKFNYHDVSRGKGLPQNQQLQPGDTVVVP